MPDKSKAPKPKKRKPVIGPRRGKKVGRPTKPGKLPETKGFSIPQPEKKPDEPLNGNVEMLHEKVRRTMQLRSLNFDYHDIQEIIAEEFKCDPPAFSTIHSWIAKYHEAADQDCKDLINERRQQQDRIINTLLKRWMPVAAAEKFQVTRYRTVEGETVPVIDQNAYDEQAKAGAICIKLLERQSKLWNLDISKELGDEGKVTEETVMIYIRQQLSFERLPAGAPIDVETSVERLELTAGDGDIDSI